MGKLTWGITLAGVLFAVACGSDDGETSGGGSGGSSGSGGAAGDAGGSLPFNQSPCGTCIEQKCSAEVNACQSEPDCTGYLACLRACPTAATGTVDEACEDACENPTSTAGKSALGALTACRKEGAGITCAECGVTSILDQTCGPSDETTDCAICEEEQCCVTRAACDANPACLALIACVKTCPPSDHACSVQCYTDNAAGVKQLGEHIQCVEARCPAADECGPIPAAVLCVAEKCANTQAACSSDLECWLIQGCVGECASDAACIQECIASHPSAEELFLEATACALALCGSLV